MNMKIRNIAALSAIALTLAACGRPQTINGVTYRGYGLANYSERHNPKVHYRPIMGNIIWGVILCETLIAPIYFIGWSIMEPDGLEADHTPQNAH